MGVRNWVVCQKACKWGNGDERGLHIEKRASQRMNHRLKLGYSVISLTTVDFQNSNQGRWKGSDQACLGLPNTVSSFTRSHSLSSANPPFFSGSPNPKDADGVVIRVLLNILQGEALENRPIDQRVRKSVFEKNLRRFQEAWQSQLSQGQSSTTRLSATAVRSRGRPRSFSEFEYIEAHNVNVRVKRDTVT